jgi:hypothetical protein
MIIQSFGAKVKYLQKDSRISRSEASRYPRLNYLVINNKLESFNENEYYKHFTVKNNSYEKLYEVLNERTESKINEMKELYKEQLNKSIDLDEIEI